MFSLGVEVKGKFSFTENVIFDGLEFRLETNAWTCLLGASGIGKSTLLRLIAGLDTEGRFEGEIKFSDELKSADSIAYMAQSDLLLPWLTVEQNVTLGSRLRKDTIDVERVNQLLEQVGLSEHRHKKPKQLSGGMRQRAALARTLMEDTPIVLLDEPFSALDSKTRAQMQELAFQVLDGKTVLLVTHDIPEAMRLGNFLYVFKEESVSLHSLPQTKPLRELNSPEILQQQALLLSVLNS
jgi:putative hydroxymethylpyrimidine transport system ATP-binding protein